MRRLLWVLLLAGCASAPLPTQPLSRPAQVEAWPFALNGRITARHNGERSTANLRWTHRAAEDDILLMTPLGQTVAHIFSNAEGVVLDTKDKHYSAGDTELLTQKALGWHLPLAGLRYWVLAEPAPTSDATVEHDANGQASAMYQDGWEIRYTRYATETADSLPQRMTLQREGTELQLLIDEWETQ